MLISAHAQWDTISYIYILDGQKRFTGVISIKELCAAPADQRMGAHTKSRLISVHPNTSLRSAAAKAIAHGIKVIPVTDAHGVWQGVIDTDTLLATLEHEHIRDVLHLSGVHKQASMVDLTTSRLRQLIAWRTPWLLVGLFGGMLMTSITDAFRADLERVLALAFFIPVIVYMGDAVGTQAQTLYIRAIALAEVKPLRYITRECIVDGWMGLISAACMFPFAWFITQSVDVTIVITISVFLVMLIAGPIGIIIPELLRKAKRDPAVGGGPFTTIIQDVVSLLLYFFIASAWLS